jgi:hypothetical protein
VQVQVQVQVQMQVGYSKVRSCVLLFIESLLSLSELAWLLLHTWVRVSYCRHATQIMAARSKQEDTRLTRVSSKQ